VRVEVIKLTDEKLMQEACSFTLNKESKMTLDKIYKCGHSPIRTQLFAVKMYDIPTFVSVHLVRHNIGITHFVKSNREDLPGYTGDLGRLQPVNHFMLMNAEALINMARKRLCAKAHIETQNLIHLIRAEVAKVDLDLVKYMIRECEYRNGYCPELKSCGKIKNGN
jgi:hypothetical protein